MNVKAQLLAVIFLALLTACTSIPADIELQSASAGKSEPVVNDVVKDYRQWTRVNPQPAIMDPFVATMCAPPVPIKRETKDGNPHRNHFVTVYVNDLGTKAMMQEKEPHFPQGSVIVKEKLPNRDNSSSPELLTVMIKREAGYNPVNGDWEYVVLDGTTKEVKARGHLEKCQACHTMVKTTDYVYRSYLPPDASQKLK